MLLYGLGLYLRYYYSHERFGRPIGGVLYLINHRSLQVGRGLSLLMQSGVMMHSAHNSSLGVISRRPGTKPRLSFGDPSPAKIRSPSGIGLGPESVAFRNLGSISFRNLSFSGIRLVPQSISLRNLQPSGIRRLPEYEVCQNRSRSGICRPPESVFLRTRPTSPE